MRTTGPMRAVCKPLRGFVLTLQAENWNYSWFQNFAVFRMLDPLFLSGFPGVWILGADVSARGIQKQGKWPKVNDTKSKILFYPILPHRLQKQNWFWHVSRFRPFVLRVTSNMYMRMNKPIRSDFLYNRASRKFTWNPHKPAERTQHAVSIKW